LRDARLLLQNLRDSIICKKTFIKRKNLIVTKKQKKWRIDFYPNFNILDYYDETRQYKKVFAKKKVNGINCLKTLLD